MDAPADRDDLYANEGQRRILRLIKFLAGHEITGVRPAQIARDLKCSNSVVTRDLANLRAEGFAERVPETQAWRLAPPIVQISFKHATAVERASIRLDEVRNRFSRS
jgi:DNA-binding IclR family transcriptional regulator